MDRFRAPSLEDDRRAIGSDRRERQRVEQTRIVTALVALDDWAWAEIKSEDYDGLTDAHVEYTAAKADRLERLVADCLHAPAPSIGPATAERMRQAIRSTLSYAGLIPRLQDEHPGAAFGISVADLRLLLAALKAADAEAAQ